MLLQRSFALRTTLGLVDNSVNYPPLVFMPWIKALRPFVIPAYETFCNAAFFSCRPSARAETRRAGRGLCRIGRRRPPGHLTQNGHRRESTR